MARQIGQTYYNVGHDGDPGGGDHTTLYGYAYIKTATSVERGVAQSRVGYADRAQARP
jgi:hypothetical protein